MKIAVFDPSESFRSFLKITINECLSGISWQEFDGIYAENACEHEYDVIVTSSELSDGTFDALVKAVRKSNFNNETPIFLFTSEMNDDALDNAFKMGVTDVYSKHDLIESAERFARMIGFTESVTGAHILLLEDDKAVAKYYKYIFSVFGFVVHLANSCESALTVLDIHPIELAVTDINLDKGGQGQRVIRKIRESRAVDEHGMPIMVMSGHSSPQYKTCLFYLGIDEYIVKPALPREIALRAIHLIQKYRTEKAAIKQASYFKSVAHYDNLTGVYSRHGFLNVAGLCIANGKRQGTRTGIIFIDLDDFKPVNDSLGHEAGDKVLIAFSQIFKNSLREQDIVCRWGGDEFVALLQNCDESFLHAIADRIKKDIIVNQDVLRDVGGSLGLSSGHPKTVPDLLAIVDQADKAMYISKRKQKGSATVYSAERAS